MMWDNHNSMKPYAKLAREIKKQSKDSFGNETLTTLVSNAIANIPTISSTLEKPMFPASLREAIQALGVDIKSEQQLRGKNLYQKEILRRIIEQDLSNIVDHTTSDLSLTSFNELLTSCLNT